MLIIQISINDIYLRSNLQSLPIPSHPLKYLDRKKHITKKKNTVTTNSSSGRLKNYPNPEVTEKVWLYNNKKECSFHGLLFTFKKKAHSRRDQRYMTTRPTSRTSGVDQGCLNESTTFAVKSTTPWRIKLVFYKRCLRIVILACLQVT